ncbi:MAG: NAD(+) synthase [Clostridiaceae bacterium]|jgi:NAD+ synthetase|nr:NAD(+) synthase [Clostridiaceae bacterium]
MSRTFSSSTGQVKIKTQAPMVFDALYSPGLEEENQPLGNDTDRKITLGTAVPAINLGDVESNARAIRDQMTEAEELGCDLLLFSDLALTGATCGMLFLQKTLQESCRHHIVRLARSTKKSSMITVLTVPLVAGTHLVKAAVWLSGGHVLCVIPLHPSGNGERSIFVNPSNIYPESIRILTADLNAPHSSKTLPFREGFEMEIPLSFDIPDRERPERERSGRARFGPEQNGFPSDFKKDLNTPFYGDVLQRGLSLDDIDTDLERCLRNSQKGGESCSIRGIPLFISWESAPLHIDYPLPIPSKNLVLARLGRAIPLFLLPDTQSEWTGAASAGRKALMRFADEEGAVVVYAGAGAGESVGEGVFAGRRLILAGQRILAESDPFTTGITCATIDLDNAFSSDADNFLSFDTGNDPSAEEDDVLSSDRSDDLTTDGGAVPSADVDDDLDDSSADSILKQDDSTVYRLSMLFQKKYSLQVSKDTLHHSRFPLIEAPGVSRRTLFTETLTIQAHALATRLKTVGVRPVLGLSGGLDSAIAFLVCLKAADLLRHEPSFVLACSMPGPGSSKTSVRLARILGESAGVDFREIPIHRETASHLEAIGHDGVTHDVTYENAQARERTQILMDLSNMEKGLVIGTGDLSEMALGWCTYNGDQMSMYAVNSTLSKTVIRLMAEEAADMLEGGSLFPKMAPEKARAMATALREILARPVSPELLPPHADDTLRQITEDAVGPYELVDFYLWHFVFLKEKPSDILELAVHVFRDTYTRDVLKHWLLSFIRRFFNSQFKRKAAPDGIACFPWQIVPVSTWYMPSDASSQLWLDDLLE